jgi:hypothetical protein
LNELVERTPEEQRVLLERMKSLAQMWSGRYDLTFLPTPGMFAVGMSDEAGRELARMMSDPSAL